MKSHYSLCFFIVLCLLFSSLVHSKIDDDGRVNTGQDATRPINRVDFKFKYVDVSRYEDEYIVISRADRVFRFGDGWKFAVRLDIPYTVEKIKLPEENKTVTEHGIDDLFYQLGFVTPEICDWRFAFGARFVFPTASPEKIGNGKYQIAPIVVVRHNLDFIMKDWWAALLLRYHKDVGGSSCRLPVNYLIIWPQLYLHFRHDIFIDFKPEFRYDFEVKKWHVPFAVTLGKKVSENVILSFEYEVALEKSLPLWRQEFQWRISYLY